MAVPHADAAKKYYRTAGDHFCLRGKLEGTGTGGERYEGKCENYFFHRLNDSS